MYGDGVITYVVKTTVEKLTDIVDLKATAEHGLNQLENVLRLMKPFLEDSNKLEKTKVFMERERQIREFVYDVEDTIATCWTKNPVSRLSTEMEKGVKSLLEKDLPQIKEMIATFEGIQQPPNEIKTDQPTREKSVDFLDEATVVEYLMESTENQLDVIAISGMPGLGKTTFARKILGHQSVIRKFEHRRIWVDVSEKFDYKDVCLQILSQILTKGITRIPSDEDLSDTVRGCLEKESFLLVTDDVWTAQDWDKINEILPEGNGKVLVTTRMNNVAAHVSNSRLPHELKGLGENEGLELLKLKVFGKKSEGVLFGPPGLEEIGKDIVKKCGGVPLIILVVGGFLKGFSTPQYSIPSRIEEKWLEVSETVSDILRKDEKNIIKNFMESSYKRLSEELRLCFLYTGLFPDNQEISTSTLTQLWIAEGFVQKVEGERLEKTAEKILNTLIDMNLLMIIRQSPNQVKTCRLHDMMRGFCRTIAKDENLFREIKKSDGEFDPALSEVPNFRRLCFNSDPTEFLSERCKVPRVRSFLCLSKESVDLDPKHISTISNTFKMLRVLNCKFINFRRFPKVKKLRLLKHVTLSIGNRNVVPKQISQLVNLETLIVLTKSHSITVKANIWKMIQLRRLKTKATIVLTKKWWEGNDQSCKSQTLQTISRLSHESCDASFPKRAPNLKVLAIQGKVADLFNTVEMENLGQLEKLKLVNDQSTASDNPLVLRQHCFPPNLNSLTLSSTYLKWEDHMPILAKIKLLKVLKLKANAFDGITWNARDGDFPNLQFLLIDNVALLTWNVSTKSFPSLTWLVVKNCKDLQTIPRSLGKLLEKLEIERVNNSVVGAAKDIESDIQTEIISNHPWRKVPLKLTIGPRYGYLARQPRIGAER